MSLRRRALEALCRVTEDGAYANLTLKDAAVGLSEQDANWLSALVYETLDHLLWIDYVLSAFISSRPKRMVRGILRLGICQLLLFSTPSHAAINESVKLAKEIGKGADSGFINAVLRRIDRSRDGGLPQLPADPMLALSIKYSYPEWLIWEWVSVYGVDFTERLLSAPIGQTEIRAQYPATAQTLQSELQQLGIPTARGVLDENCFSLLKGLDVTKLDAFTHGRFAVQSQSAMLVCRALGDCHGMDVLDACAAPGGKSAYIASLAENNLRLVAFEKHAHRVQLMETTFSRLHVSAKCRLYDAQTHDSSLEESFDRVLLDVPCSGLGLVHDKPDIRYRKGDSDIHALANIQAQILTACASYVKEDGILVYATCTISRRENEDQIQHFLADNPHFCLDPMPISLPNDGMIQLFPQIHATDGFFIARMKRCKT